MGNISLEARDQINAIEHELRVRTAFDMLDDRERAALAKIVWKIGCDVDTLIRLLIQMGLDVLARVDTREMVYFSALCNGRPQVDLSDDDLPF